MNRSISDEQSMSSSSSFFSINNNSNNKTKQKISYSKLNLPKTDQFQLNFCTSLTNFCTSSIKSFFLCFDSTNFPFSGSNSGTLIQDQNHFKMFSSNVFAMFGMKQKHPKKDGVKLNRNGAGYQEVAKGAGVGGNLRSIKNFEHDLEIITQRLAAFPGAVDLLILVLDKIIKEPKNQKFRRLNKTKATYKTKLETAEEWGKRFLLLVDFEESDEFFTMRRSPDSAKLWLAKEKLESLKSHEIYMLNKDKEEFKHEVERFIEDGSETENVAKAECLEKVPREPKPGAAGTTRVRVYFGSQDISRKFHSDDSLNSVLNWIYATWNSKILNKLESGEWEIVDRSYFPPKLIDMVEEQKDFSGVTKNKFKTLQALNLWPSGEIEIQKGGWLLREKALNGEISPSSV